MRHLRTILVSIGLAALAAVGVITGASAGASMAGDAPAVSQNAAAASVHTARAPTAAGVSGQLAILKAAPGTVPAAAPRPAG